MGKIHQAEEGPVMTKNRLKAGQRKLDATVKVQKTRLEISLIKNQLTQPTHLVGGNRGVLEFKLAKVESKLTS